MIFLIFIALLYGGKNYILLKYTPKIGEENLYKITTVSNHQFKTNLNYKTSSKLEIILNEKISNFKDSHYTVNYKISELNFTFNGEKIKNPLLKEIKNSTYTVRISTTGKILNKNNETKIYIPQFPQKKIKIGENWNFKRRSFIPIGKTNIDVEIKGTYTLKEIKNNKVKITGKLRVKAINIYPKKLKKRVESSFEGKGKSEIIYNYKKSELLSLKEELSLRTTSKAFFPDFPTQKFKMKHIIKTELKKIK